ncbi:MAG: hypothetical protein HFACDABA_02328 [Anaerolineales bacterium]|nr:hypothetical protein [Anaerolineales bacterium]
MGYADTHIHSLHSGDGSATVRAILKQAADIGLNVIAITDHDAINGSLEARELASHYNLEVVTGVEVSTSEGHLLALYVEQLPPAGRSLGDTLLWIGYHGGLAVAPHPFTDLPLSLTLQSVINVFHEPRIKGVLQGIETYNHSTRGFNKTAEKLSVYLPLAKMAGSDAHLYWAVGMGRTYFPGSSAADLRDAIGQARTSAIPFEGAMPSHPLLSLARRLILRKFFGYASDAPSASLPVDTQRVPAEMLQKARESFRRKKKPS